MRNIRNINGQWVNNNKIWMDGWMNDEWMVKCMDE